MKKLLCAAVLLGLLTALFAACGGGGGGDDAGTGPGESPAASTSGNSGSSGGPAKLPDEVEAAPKDGVNAPKAGTYLYDYESEVTNSNTPDATPRRSEPGSELSSKVSYDGDIATIAEKSTVGDAVATVERRFADDGVYELSFLTEAGTASSGCEFSKPLKILDVPIEKGELPKQTFVGEGSSCKGQRTVTIEDEEVVEDADGVSWTTRRVIIKNTVEASVTVSSRSTLTMWFSPDLGKEIKTESVVESIANGSVQARGESATLLKSYPT